VKLELDQFEQQIGDAPLALRQGNLFARAMRPVAPMRRHTNVWRNARAYFGGSQDKPSVNGTLRTGRVHKAGRDPEQPLGFVDPYLGFGSQVDQPMPHIGE